MALGLFQVRGGAEVDPVYEITSPIFDRVTIHLDPRYYPGGKFVITARHNSPEHPYIQSAFLNGKPACRRSAFDEQAGGGQIDGTGLWFVPSVLPQHPGCCEQPGSAVIVYKEAK